MPIGAGGLYAIGDTGGNANAIVVSHTHSATGTAITGTFYASNRDGPAPTGAFSYTVPQVTASSNFSGGGPQNDIKNYTFNATPTVTNSTFGDSPTNANLPPYLGIQFIIKT
jgi:hypothetical protein